MNFAAFHMNRQFINWTFFILLCFVWGSSFILMKESKTGLSALQIGSLRIFSAGLVFLPFAIFHLAKIPRNKWKHTMLAGVFGNLLPAFLFPLAIMHIDSSLAGILNSLTPLLVVVLGLVFFKDRISRIRIFGVLLGFAGLCLLTLAREDISLANFGYALLVLLAALSYAINVNLVGHNLKGINSLHVATVSLAFMLIPSGIVLWQQGFLELDFSENAVQWAIVNTVFLGVVSSALATVAFYFLVQKAGGLFASLVTYGIPFVAIFWGVRDGEKIGLLQVACLLLILLGVFLANRKEKKPRENNELSK